MGAPLSTFVEGSTLLFFVNLKPLGLMDSKSKQYADVLFLIWHYDSQDDVEK